MNNIAGLRKQDPHGTHYPGIPVRVRAPQLLTLAVLLLASLLAASQNVYLCFESTDTGHVLADFTLRYQTWNTTPIVDLSTAGITVTASGYCYRFEGISADPTVDVYFRATLPNGHYQQIMVPQGGAVQGVAWSSQFMVIPSAYNWYKGDTLPAISLTITRGLSSDPTGASVTFNMQKQGVTSLLKVSGGDAGNPTAITGPYSDGTYGCTLTYQWNSGDLDMADASGAQAAIYNGQFVVVFSGGQKLSLPLAHITVNRNVSAP